MSLEQFLEHYAHYQTGKTLPQGFSIEAPAERENTVLYAWINGDTWLLTKEGDAYNTESVTDLASLLKANPDRKIEDNVNLYILESDETDNVFTLPSGYSSRLLNKEDQQAFEIFHAACPKDDKEEGQVDLDDPLVYGILYGEQIVAVASFWYWGDHIADIGVLTHPDFRRKGLMKVAVMGIAANTERTLFWRADKRNTGSNKTAQSCGLTPIGAVVDIIR